MVQGIWSVSILLALVSLAIMVALIVVRVVRTRELAQRTLARTVLLKALIRFGGDGDVAALAIVAGSTPMQVVAESGFEFLDLLRGEEHSRVIAALERTDLRAYIERQLRHGNEVERIRGAEMLAAFPPKSVVGSLLRAMEGDPSHEVRIAATLSLSRLGEMPLMDRVLRHIGEGVRSRRLVDLFLSLPSSRHPELGDAASAPKAGPYIRAACIEALGLSRELRWNDLFNQLSMDSSPEVSSAAVRALGRLGHPGAWKPVLLAMANDDWQVRADAATVAGQLTSPELMEPLCALLDDENWTVRYAAANALKHGSEASRIRLESEAGNTVESRVQRTASLALLEGPV